MGICPCEGTKNIIIMGEISVPNEDNLLLNSKNNDQNILIIPEEKHITKKVISFTKLSNNINPSYSLGSLINDILNQEAPPINLKSSSNAQRLSIKGRNELLRKLTEKEGSAISKKSSKRPNPVNQDNKHTSDEDDVHNKNLIKNKDVEYTIDVKEIAIEEEEMLIYQLQHHFLFWEYHIEMIKSFIEAICIIRIESNTFLFNEGEICSGFFIIKSGIVELKNKEKTRQLNHNASFGELGLLSKEKEEYLSEYSAYSKEHIELYYLAKSAFNKILSDFDKSIEDNEDINQSNMTFIESNYLLKELPMKYKKSIAALCRPFSFNTNDLIISTKTQTNPILNRPKTLMYITSGEVTEIFHSTSSTEEMRNKVALNETAGVLYTMFKPHDKAHYEIIAFSSGASLVVSENAFIESIGPNYRYEILFSFFSSFIIKSELIKELLNEESPEQLFQGFTIKEYKSNEIVFNHCNYENMKLCMVLNGDLLNSKNAKVKLSKGILHGDIMINSNQE